MTPSPDPVPGDLVPEQPLSQPPAPPPGSPSAFALLYCPAGQRREFALLLALEAELGAGVTRRLDHALAHARLDWWRSEADRACEGAARHPWLRGQVRDLRSLVHAALVDLAEAQRGTPRPRRLRGALFCAAAGRLDGQSLAEPEQSTLATLGALCAELDAPASMPAGTLDSLRDSIAQIDPNRQRAWAPLLVWCALGARQATRAPAASRLAALAAPFSDNIAAWRAARAACTGTLRLP